MVVVHMADPLLRTLDEIDGTDLSLVGGKAYRLATLKQNGFNVPPGIVLTTVFFEQHLQYCQLTPLWAGSPDVAVTVEALSWLANTIKTKPISRHFVDLLNAHMKALFPPHVTDFAVRSSAIDEDQRDHTFAGIHLTELSVPRSALLIAVTRCWASALDEPALKYRQAHGMSIQGIKTAVLIQPMLKPRSSGVGFTVNPLTGAEDEVVIEATWGLGNALVSGEVQPHFYRLSNQSTEYPLLEEHKGNIAPPQSIVTDEGPLDRANLTQLALQLAQIQALMGEAQDIEWAQLADGFYFLQARPVILPASPKQTTEQAWSRANFPEHLPILPSPFFVSLMQRVQHEGLAFFESLGLDLDNLSPYIRIVLGRPYLNLTLVKRLITQLGLSPSAVLHRLGFPEPSASLSIFAINWETVWKQRRIYQRTLRQIFSQPHVLDDYRAAVAPILQMLAVPDPEAPPDVLLDQLRQQERLQAAYMRANLQVTINISALTVLGGRLLISVTKTPVVTFTALALNRVETNDKKLTTALHNLADVVDTDNAILAYLEDYLSTPDGTWQPPAAFAAPFNKLLSIHGKRATYDADMGQPRYAEDPRPLLRIIQQYTHAPHPQDEHTVAITWRSVNRAAPLWTRLLPWRQLIARRLVHQLQKWLTVREDLHMYRAEAVAISRQWGLALGQHWVSKGWLAAANDIFWLSFKDIERVFMLSAKMGVTLKSLIEARRATYRSYADTDMPYTLTDSQIHTIRPGMGISTAAPTEVLLGLPISPGQIHGTVLVLNHPDEFEPIAEDIILVMPSTDPAWLPLLHLAKGLIVEMGGLLSHGSVIAREYGLPAVANIPQATKRFHTGDIVLVDGSTGIVQLLESASQEENQEVGSRE